MVLPIHSSILAAIEKAQKKETKKEKEVFRNRASSPQPLSLGLFFEFSPNLSNHLGPLLCGDPEEQVSSMPVNSKRSSKSTEVSEKETTSKTQKSASKAVKKISPKTVKTNGAYYLHQKHVVLNANIDGIPISTNLVINIKSKNKDARVDLKEM